MTNRKTNKTNNSVSQNIGNVNGVNITGNTAPVNIENLAFQVNTLHNLNITEYKRLKTKPLKHIPLKGMNIFSGIAGLVGFLGSMASFIEFLINHKTFFFFPPSIIFVFL